MKWSWIIIVGSALIIMSGLSWMNKDIITNDFIGRFTCWLSGIIVNLFVFNGLLRIWEHFEEK